LLQDLNVSYELVADVVEVRGQPVIGLQCPQERRDLDEERRVVGLLEQERDLAVQQLNG